MFIQGYYAFLLMKTEACPDDVCLIYDYVLFHVGATFYFIMIMGLCCSLFEDEVGLDLPQCVMIIMTKPTYTKRWDFEKHVQVHSVQMHSGQYHGYTGIDDLSSSVGMLELTNGPRQDTQGPASRLMYSIP
jgi:hypothetical protein